MEACSSRSSDSIRRQLRRRMTLDAVHATAIAAAMIHPHQKPIAGPSARNVIAQEEMAADARMK
jgi:hypothetical protein